MNPSTQRESNAIGSSGDELFRSFFMGGFECSTHRLHTGRRLDVVAATHHDRFCELDYRRLLSQGIRTAREGIRWHLIEPEAGRYDFSSVLPMVRASRKTGMQLIWDLCHYGWPNDIDVFKPQFVWRFTRMAKAFARWLSNETNDLPLITPINEISFFAWAGGDVAYLNPHCRGRSFELKTQLVRAAIEAMEAVWNVLPKTRFTLVDPVIHIIPHPNRPEDRESAEGNRMAQFQAWDMLCGNLWPQLGGNTKYLDLIGINYYPDNQWIQGFGLITRDHPLYLPFSELILEVYQRYHRPIFISETGAEDQKRTNWFQYICEQARLAMLKRVPFKGICLYPILNHPGWDDDRHCCNGLWDYCDEKGNRELYEPLALELLQQRKKFGLTSGTTNPVDGAIECLTHGDRIGECHHDLQPS